MLLLALSGLNRQEQLVIKACCADSKSFDAVSTTLVEQYSGVHLREGRTLGSSEPRRFPSKERVSNGREARVSLVLELIKPSGRTTMKTRIFGTRKKK